MLHAYVRYCFYELINSHAMEPRVCFVIISDTNLQSRNILLVRSEKNRTLYMRESAVGFESNLKANISSKSEVQMP